MNMSASKLREETETNIDVIGTQTCVFNGYKYIYSYLCQLTHLSKKCKEENINQERKLRNFIHIQYEQILIIYTC